jgi:hypothetical protein
MRYIAYFSNKAKFFGRKFILILICEYVIRTNSNKAIINIIFDNA